MSEFRNVLLTIPDVTEGEKWDRFCTGLKYELGIEVMKSNATSFEEATQIALRVDSALWSAGSFMMNSRQSGSAGEVPTPMEIGNMVNHPNRALRQGMTPQRLKDLRNNACSFCRKTGCRPWKHQKKAAVSNLEVGRDDEGRDGDGNASEQSEN